MAGPLGWDVVPACSDWQAGTTTDAQRENALEMAVHMLWSLTGKMFGLMPATVRPCFGRREHSTAYHGSGHSGPYWWPGLVNGSGMGGACGCSSGCDCIGPNQLMLPGPVESITTVMIDGIVLDPAAYRVKNRRWLLRVDGAAWPQEQDMTVPDDGEGAFTVEYLRGIPVPKAGLIAAGDLACDFLRAHGDGKGCRIPSRAQSVSRSGVDVQLLDPYMLFDQGLTGIPSVDVWIAAVNPTRARSRSRVYSPDSRTPSRLR